MDNHNRGRHTAQRAMQPQPWSRLLRGLHRPWSPTVPPLSVRGSWRGRSWLTPPSTIAARWRSCSRPRPAGAADILAHTTPGLTVRAGAHVTHANRIGARLITREDPEWPRQLTEFDDPDADRFGPVALWARGSGRLNATGGRSVADVGARARTEHGHTATHDFTTAAAGQGWAIVTGGAYGIDTAALEATLVVDGSAVVVTVSGLSHAYPATNRDLFEQVTRRGLLVSGYPPFDRPTRDRFLHRNRVIAALGRAGMVVP